LLSLPMLGPDQVTDSLHAYQLAKRGNSLRVMAEAVRWGKRGARVNTISPGIIFTPLANRRGRHRLLVLRRPRPTVIDQAGRRSCTARRSRRCRGG
jgi:NAD(P)-dependent dehydrogenase (short-subunit alcohol dehydrogenase family)